MHYNRHINTLEHPMTTPQTKTEFTENKLNDSPEDRDIWDKLLGTEESDAALSEMVKDAEKAEQNGGLSPMDGNE